MIDKLTVIRGNKTNTEQGLSHYEIANDMAEKIKSAVYAYDKIPLSLAIGVLEIVKMEVMNDH